MYHWIALAVALAAVFFGDVMLWKLLVSKRDKLSSGLILQNSRVTDFRVAITIHNSPSTATSEIARVFNDWNTQGTFCINGNLAMHLDPELKALKELHKKRNELINGALETGATSPSEAYVLLNQTDKVLRTIRNPAAGKSVAWACGNGGAVANVSGYTFVWGNVAPLHFIPFIRQIWIDLYSWQLSWATQRGSIIVLPDDETTPDVLRQLVPGLLRRGFRLVPLSELF